MKRLGCGRIPPGEGNACYNAGGGECDGNGGGDRSGVGGLRQAPALRPAIIQ